MHIGILSARSPRYHPNRRLREAASRCGHKATLIHPKDCVSDIASGKTVLDHTRGRDRPDVLLPRIGSTIKAYALTLVRHFEVSGIPAVNGFLPILLTRNKFMSMQTLAEQGIAVPQTHYVSNLNSFKKAVTKLGGYPVVAKTVNSRQGKGVMIVKSALTAKFIMDNLIDRTQGLLVQQFIPTDHRRDIRVLVLGDRVVAAMELRPSAGDFRTNIHLNGKGRLVKLKKEIEELAVAASRALGLEISGTDIIVDGNGTAMVIEANASPGFKGLEAVAGIDIASRIIRYVAETRGGRS